MGRLKKILPKDKHAYGIITASFLLIFLILSLFCFQYYGQVQRTIEEENSDYLQEISKQMGTNISKTINDNFSVLSTLSGMLENTRVSTYQELQTVVQSLQQHWNYKKIFLVDDRGVAHDEKGKTVFLNSDDYLQDAVISRKVSFSAAQTIDGEECIAFAIPMEDRTIDGDHILALVATYDLDTFDKILAMSAFNGEGYAHIIRRDGTIVVRSSSENAFQSGYNILNSLSAATLEGDKTLAEVREDISAGKTGRIGFRLENTHEYMTYSPLEAQDWYLLTFIPMAVVNEKSVLLLRVTFFLCGLIALVFSLLLTFLVFSFYRNKSKLEQIAYVDPVTGGNTIQCFYELARQLLDDPNAPEYALIYTDIEKFKVMNEQFGRTACDAILRSIQHGIKENLGKDECMGRLFADNFCVLVTYKDEKELLVRFEKWYQSASTYMEEDATVLLPLMMKLGIYVVENAAMEFPAMIDRAKLALLEGTRVLHGKLQYAVYNEQVRRVLFREKQLEDRMEKALENREFQVYLQPKYDTQTEQINGAEALVRWLSPEEGMIYPDEFISLFERNQFIVRLDLWVFEEVCRALRRWLDNGATPMPISVNCSRVHLKSLNFFEEYRAVAVRYGVPTSLIEIELTENTVFGDVAFLTQMIEKIHLAGFLCSMDDFGSGYSSLNLIQDIPVDTLKLDRVFFRSDLKHLQRTESVVGSIVSMAKALSMQTVAEGVEKREQVDMLKRLNCDTIQGYYFAKPMPLEEFEALAFPHKPT